MSTIKFHTMVVDDELKACKVLCDLLSRYEYISQCEGVSSVKEALEYLELRPVDLIFLDIQMPGRNGFELVQELKQSDIKADIIFTTAHNEYTLQAIKAHAFDYLLKPVDPDELTRSLLNYLDYFRSKHINRKLDDLVLDSKIPEKIRINTRSGFILIDQKEIVYCEADNNYTVIHLTDNRKEVTTLNLGRVEQILSIPVFKRIGRSLIININYLYKVDRKAGKCYLKSRSNMISIPVPSNVNWDLI